MTGIEALLEVLAAAGVRHIFGNPGTTELPLNDALAGDDRFRYVLGLHEVPVMAMADGFALATGTPGVVNLHVAPGLGNAMGMLYNAFIEGSPLLVTAGQQDRRLRLSEPVIEADLVSVARPWTKWAYEVQRVEDVPPAVRRALQTALTPPTGPVFLSLPVDLQSQSAGAFDLSPPSVPDRRVRPPREGLERAAALLLAARNPVILAGSRVTESRGVGALSAVAERLGAPVYAESQSSHGRLPMPSDHPLYRGILPLWSPDVNEALREHDLILAVGLNVFRAYIHREPEQPLPLGVRLIQLDNDPREVAKNYPVEVGLIGDPASGLAELDELLAQGGGYPAQAAAAARRAHWTERRDRETERLRAELAAEPNVRPMTPLRLMDAMARVLPADIVVVEEAPTTHRNVFERLGLLKDPHGFFAHRGWGLGWGMGCALGVKLAWPDRPVLALIGDGAALYGVQALWSAARHRIPVTYVIAANAQYEILKVCGEVLGLTGLTDPRCPGLDLTDPAVDFVGLAHAFGVEAERVTEPDALSDRLRASFSSGRPRLFEVPIAR